MLILHIVTLVICNEDKDTPKWWNISWIIASLLWWIPIIWMSLHILSAILLWVDFSKMQEGNLKIIKTTKKNKK